MEALDTNALARVFIDDLDDPQASRQRPSAVQALAERAFVSVTVMLELEWVSWFNHHRLMAPLGCVPPAEFEANCYRNLEQQAMSV